MFQESVPHIISVLLTDLRVITPHSVPTPAQADSSSPAGLLKLLKLHIRVSSIYLASKQLVTTSAVEAGSCGFQVKLKLKESGHLNIHF